MWIMQFCKEGGRGGSRSSREVLLLTARSTSASRSNSAARPTDTTDIGPTCADVEVCRRLWRWRVCDWKVVLGVGSWIWSRGRSWSGAQKQDLLWAPGSTSPSLFTKQHNSHHLLFLSASFLLLLHHFYNYLYCLSIEKSRVKKGNYFLQFMFPNLTSLTHHLFSILPLHHHHEPPLPLHYSNDFCYLSTAPSKVKIGDYFFLIHIL